jgi:hypothetical protein
MIGQVNAAEPAFLPGSMKRGVPAQAFNALMGLPLCKAAPPDKMQIAAAGVFWVWQAFSRD